MLTNKNAATKKKWEEWEERRQMEQRWQALSQCDESEYSARVPQFFFSGAGYVWPRTFLARLLFVAGLLEVGFVPCNHRNGCDGLISLLSVA